MIAAGLMVGLLIFGRPVSAGIVQVEVIRADDVVTNPEDPPVVVGELRPMSALNLRAGFVSLRLRSGVGLDVVAPAQLQFESDHRVRLVSGRLNADVGDANPAFTVVTNTGQVFEQGQRFSVEAIPGEDTGAAVFSGRLRTRLGPNRNYTFLDEGEAARFSARVGLRRWDQIALAAEAAGLADQPYTGVIRSVQDNLGNQKVRPFFGIVYRGMRSGALAFTDKPNPRWAPGPDDTIPEWLHGADLIRTYHLFRQRQGYELRVAVTEPATVYVLFPHHQAVPNWLTASFEATGASLRVGPWHQALVAASGAEISEDGLPYFTFDVWRAVVHDEIQLGTAGPVHEHTLMYGVAVKALSRDSFAVEQGQ
jgi:hypothetical protein